MNTDSRTAGTPGMPAGLSALWTIILFNMAFADIPFKAGRDGATRCSSDFVCWLGSCCRIASYSPDRLPTGQLSSHILQYLTTC